MSFKKLGVLSVFALLVTFTFVTPAAAQRVPGAAGHGEGWVVLTYVGEFGPFEYPVNRKGGAVSFDFLPTPDRAMLITDISNDRQFAPGKLIGKSLSARIAISATPGATFNFYGPGTAPANVRLYFQRPNAAGCPSSEVFNPLFPQCEAQYWWSNPLSISLADLAASDSRRGVTLQALLSPEFWSDRDGHRGDSDANHIAWFNDAVANASKIALSFGGGNNFAFGCGVDSPGQATFTLLKYQVVK